LNKQHYDIIGDIHGQADELIQLLIRLGYEEQAGVYRHREKKVIFLGDFIDRGKQQQGVLAIVRPMIDSGAALSVMGNHEFNAIAYFTQDAVTGDYLRPHNDKNRKQHQAFLFEYEKREEDYADVIAWFKTLPLWLDLGELRIIHACWDNRCINEIMQNNNNSALISEVLLKRAVVEGDWAFEAIETLLKGKEIPLKDGANFKDKDGNVRHNIRVRWWDQAASTYKSAFMGPESARTHIPDDEIIGDHLIAYGHDEPPVFLGHYWMEGEPTPLAANIACLDYSVAKPGGKLVAYRWDGERALHKDKFISVARVE